MSVLLGSCLCSKVSFECNDEFEQFHLCHCIQCQKVTGSAHASNLFTSPQNIKWLTGFELVKRFDVPGRTISTAFCTECGSAVPYLSLSGEALIVPAGSLDSTATLIPQDNIFCSEKAKWYDNALKATQFNEFPE